MQTYIVDSFAPQKFKGNPAGVCLLDKPLTDTQMLNIANELGFSETAFTHKVGEVYKIRFFSPSQEIDLCGHATLATAKILFHKKLAAGIIHFKNTNHVDLMVKQDKTSSKLLMEFPAYQVKPMAVSEIPTAMLQALGISEVVNTGFNKEINSFVIEIDSCEKLASLTPDFEKLVQSVTNIDGVAVTAISDKFEYDFESRYFWPWVGTNEDPVTGAMHTFLATYWGEKLNKTELNALQCSARGGLLQIALNEKSTVILKGEAQIMLEGVFYL
ncbi:MAG: phenazine biosynthesis protein PhzF [Gammaproteobacteria bacterium]|nr:MAG: phenazine biosynthesis protein PhzF [Gammaproteobacteria bacterium]